MRPAAERAASRALNAVVAFMVAVFVVLMPQGEIGHSGQSRQEARTVFVVRVAVGIDFSRCSIGYAQAFARARRRMVSRRWRSDLAVALSCWPGSSDRGERVAKRAEVLYVVCGGGGRGGPDRGKGGGVVVGEK